MTRTAPRGLIVCLPDAPLDDHVAVVEVLIQAGLVSFAVPARSAALPELARIFGARATFLASRVTVPGDVHAAIAAGVTLLLADDATEELAAAAIDAGARLWCGAMTATEIRAVLRLPVAGAVLWPADVVGHSFAARLAEIDLVTSVLPMGGVGAYAAGEWLEAGAQAVCVDSALLGDAYDGGALGRLRDRCQAFVGVQQRHLD